MAQEAQVTAPPPLPTIEDSRPWQISTFLEYPSHNFLISTGPGRGSFDYPQNRLLFAPSNAPEVGMRLSRGLFSLQYRTSVKSMENIIYDEYDIGKTTLTDLKASGELGYFKLDLFHQKFSGFFVDLNSRSGFTVAQGKTDPAPTPTPPLREQGPKIIVRSDMHSLNYGVKPQLIFPAYDPRNKKSYIPYSKEYGDALGVLFTASALFHHLEITGNAPFVPEERRDFFPQDFSWQGITQNALGIGLGGQLRFYPGERWASYLGVRVDEEVVYQVLESEVTQKKQLVRGETLSMDLGLEYQRGRHQLAFTFDMELRMSKMAVANLDSMRTLLGTQYSLAF